MWTIQLFKLNFDYREEAAVREVVASGWLTMGEKIARFEEKFGQFIGSGAHCTAVANGTAALHMALLTLDVGAGDEVIIPALTFVADANVVRLVGARPVLADCADLDNWNVTVESIERRITAKTKAVIVVHYAGFPCDMAGITKLCRERGIRLIEDAAHAPGAIVGGKYCGTWGDVGCFSFFSNKNLSIGEGGMVSTLDEQLNQRLRYLRSHGMTTATLDRHKGRAVTYDVVAPGLNYRMDEMRAAIGLVQLEKLAPGNQRRKELTELYRYNFKESPIVIPFENLTPDCQSAYHILPVLLPYGTNRNAVMEFLKSKGIQSSIHYPPFWRFSGYADDFSPADTAIAAEICERELTLPLFPTMTNREVDIVCSALIESLK